MTKRTMMVLAVWFAASTAWAQDPVERPSATQLRAPSPSLQTSARARVEDLRTRFRVAGQAEPAIAPATGTTFEAHGALYLRTRVPARERGTVRPANVVLGAHADLAASVEDAATGVALRFTLRGAQPSVGDLAEGVVVYPKALAGADVVHRADADGVEDFVVFEERPVVEELVYDVDVSRAAGLRLVGNTLELLDAAGTPALRVAPPWIVDTHGEKRAVSLRVEGCAFDTNSAPPWNRAVVAPGATTCALRVSWASPSYPLLVDPSWTTTGSLASVRTGHSATALLDGRALIAGGTDVAPLATTELYDATTGTFASGPSMAKARSGHSATRLPSGKVLVAAGGGGGFTAEIYDPATGAFAAPITMLPGMGRSVGALLKNGKVLLVGPSASVQLFDEAAGTFTVTGSPSKNSGQGLRLLPLASGKAVLEHGVDPDFTLEIYDPAVNGFSGFVEPEQGFRHPGMSVLPNDKVLVTGGYSLFPQKGSRLYDPVTLSNVASGDMAVARSEHTATLLHNGETLIAGGTTKNNAERAAEVYDWKTGKFGSTPSLALPHPHPTVTVLASGKVLLLDPEKTAELYEPSRLTGEGCKANADCLSGFCTDGVCCEAACGGSCQACNLPGHLGSCTLVAGAPPASRRACDGSGPCGGTCDGSGPGCAYPLPAITCASKCLANKQTTSRCNGEGTCIEADAKSCNNLVCADQRSCKTTCVTKADCLDTFECSGGACVVGYTCTGDHTAQPIAGAAIDCAPYRCAGRCLESCTSVNDCATPNVCDSAGKCVKPVEPITSSCAVSRAARSQDGGELLIGMALVVVGLARTRRRARGGER